MSKSVSIPLSLSDLRGGSARLPPRKSPYTSLSPFNHSSRSLDGFILSLVEKDGRCFLYGSTAESAGISIGDEVIGVNGRNVEGRNHNQLVNIIQECIRSRNISLRVRRNRNENIREELLSKSAVIREVILVAVKKEESEGIIENLNKLIPSLSSSSSFSSYPGISTFDMEEIAKGESHIFPSVHIGSNGSTNMRNEEEMRMKRYDDDIRERKERQFQRQKENQLLRSSLRASKKLKSLTENEKRGMGKKLSGREEIIEMSLDQRIREERGSGYENDCFLVSDSSCREGMEGTVDTPDEQPSPFDQIILSVERIAEHLNSSEGRPEEGRLIREFFTSPPVKSAIEASSGHSPVESSSRVCHEVITENLNLRIVTFYKENDAYLGATVRNDGHRLVVGRIVAGGIAEKTGLLQEGDELLEVNGLELRGRNVGQVCDVLRGLRGEIRVVINTEGRKKKERMEKGKKLRALFDYHPNEDVFVPCRELALSFSRGDVLHIMDTSDSNWWQATLDGSECRDELAGIIPSPSFRQEVMHYQEEEGRKTRREAKKIIPDIMNTMKKREKEMVIGDENGPLPSLDLSYEEVSLHLSRSSHKRALVLCSPEGMGSLQLRQSLLEKEGDRLVSPIPFTSRTRKEGEIDGIHYHFVSRSNLIEMAKSGQLVEFGEFEKNLYGTALADIVSVREKGKTCLLTLKPQSLWSIRKSSVMPFVVFIAPPSAVQLRRQKEIMGERNVTDDDLRRIIAQAKSIQQQYGHLFDMTIVNTEMSRSLEDLRSLLHRLETEPSGFLRLG